MDKLDQAAEPGYGGGDEPQSQGNPNGLAGPAGSSPQPGPPSPQGVGLTSEAQGGQRPKPEDLTEGAKASAVADLGEDGAKASAVALGGTEGGPPKKKAPNGVSVMIVEGGNGPMTAAKASEAAPPPTLLAIESLSFYFGDNKVLKGVDMPVRANSITSLIGPSGCGKTTLLRCLNRMHDLYPNNRYEGRIVMEGRNILDKGEDLIGLRSRLGMVFQKPTPFPMSVYDNIAYGLKLKKITNKPLVRELVEKALRQANLWEEVKDRLKESALGLSGGQQQRLSIARSLAVGPAVLLFDEATSALDPISSAKVEEMMVELKKEVTMVVVTHNMQQAARISDYTALMWLGSLIEYGETIDIFTRPKQKMTEQYVAGNFG